MRRPRGPAAVFESDGGGLFFASQRGGRQENTLKHSLLSGLEESAERPSDFGDEERRWTLVYDGNCTVCGRVVRLVERWDRRKQIETIPSQSPIVLTRFPWIPAEAYADALQLIGPGGRTSQGADAIEDLLGILPRGWLIGWVFKLPLVGWLADKLYRWFARNRYRFGCGAHCPSRPPRLD